MRRAVRVVLAIAAAVAVLAAVGLVRASRLTSVQVPPGEPARIAIDSRAAAERLAAAIRIPTINWNDPQRFDPEPFHALHANLAAAFPRVATTLTREAIADFSLLYTWPGSDPALAPLILTAHLDVVPAEMSAAWTHPPFSGAVTDTAVWGRGAIDDKSGVLGLLEAVEALLERNVTPARTVYLAFGHNEEGVPEGDRSGAGTIADALAARGVREAWLLDEGGLIYDRVPGVPGSVAFIGIAEKTAVDVELRVRSAGGHAAMPPQETAVGILARAIDRVERHPMPARLDGATARMFDTLAPEMQGPLRFAFANLWLMRPLAMRQLASRPETNATVRTTFAPTLLHGSEKSNVLATDARTVINVRLLPGDTVAAVLAHLRDVIDDARVEITAIGSPADPPPVASTETEMFTRLQRAIRAMHPDVLVAPLLTTAATDARHYADVAPNLYRFHPVRQPGALETMHGPGEHIQLDAYADVIRTYATIIETLVAR